VIWFAYAISDGLRALSSPPKKCAFHTKWTVLRELRKKVKNNKRNYLLGVSVISTFFSK